MTNLFFFPQTGVPTGYRIIYNMHDFYPFHFLGRGVEGSSHSDKVMKFIPCGFLNPTESYIYFPVYSTNLPLTRNHFILPFVVILFCFGFCCFARTEHSRLDSLQRKEVNLSSQYLRMENTRSGSLCDEDLFKSQGKERGT